MNEQAIQQYNAPASLRFFAKVISYVFHPLFIPTYVYFFLTQAFPYEFSGLLRNAAVFRTVIVLINTAFFPAVAIFLLWRLKFIESIFLRSQKERIAPYMIVMVFYWWVWYLSKNFTDQPFELRVFFLGIFLTTPVALVLNNFFKISMHAIGVGSLLAFMMILSFVKSADLSAAVAISLIITGLVCTARFIVSDHTNKDIYTGLILGIVCQLVAAYFTF
jgi:hypothetical protein